jgi:aminoglycoside phosphotransferase (APT) family kinase protein
MATRYVVAADGYGRGVEVPARLGEDGGEAPAEVLPALDGSMIDEALVRSLLLEQLPQLAGLPVVRVHPGGNDHRTFRLGEDLLVRLPSAPGYVPQVRKEQTWLPRLAPYLPLPVPEVRAVGVPSELFPAPWSVYAWLDGEPVSSTTVDDQPRLAADVAGFLSALRDAPSDGGPGPGPHSAWRGAPLEHLDEEVRAILHRVRGRERDLAATIWRDALAAPFVGTPVWFHGDVAAANLLVRDGRLSAVIDLGCAGVGDPACDTVLLWTHLHGAARDVFRVDLGVDEATWARGRGWALWKALIMLTNEPPAQRALARHVLDSLLAEV